MLACPRDAFQQSCALVPTLDPALSPLFRAVRLDAVSLGVREVPPADTIINILTATPPQTPYAAFVAFGVRALRPTLCPVLTSVG